MSCLEFADAKFKYARGWFNKCIDEFFFAHADFCGTIIFETSGDRTINQNIKMKPRVHCVAWAR